MRAVAIVNGNARRLRGRLRSRLEKALPGRVRFTESLDEARTTIRAEVKRGAELIVLGGGDGTVVMGLTLIGEACRGAGKAEPSIGILRLGSGNAIADTLGAGDDVVEDLERLVRGGGRRRTVPMIEVLGVRAPFVGMGVDALLLEDQEAVARVVDRVPVARRLLGGASRYALSVALRSVPRFAAGARPNAVVTNLGGPAIEMARSGPTGREEPAGQIIWKGACTLVAGATIPFFGFGLKMFAFANRREGKFHLRCGDAGLFEIMRNTPAAFRGDYFSDNVTDYLCDRVAIELDQETAIEAGGELLGRRNHVELAIAPAITMLALENSPR
ncbi:MAG TPA: diacylglycerol kinase family protein [Kofleriaceae bacterium]|nr:diacylglycerol kinase family protein [Kofleriaceae bacterium]